MKTGERWDRAAENVYPGGSFGNGAAMRIAPIALFRHDNIDRLIEVTTEASKITHTHMLGIVGAVLQAISITQAFKSDPKAELDVNAFILNLKVYVSTNIYLEKISHIQNLYSRSPSKKKVVTLLGNSI